MIFGILIAGWGATGCTGIPAAQTKGAVAPREPQPADHSTTVRVSEGDRSLAGGREEHARLADDWGIEPLGVTLSAAGYMLDFRYRVVDSEKAALFMNQPGERPCLIDEATGARVFVPNAPKVGSLRQKSRAPIAGRTYFILFANPGRFVKRGSGVMLSFGDCEIRGLTVYDPTPPAAQATVSACDEAAKLRMGSFHPPASRPGCRG